MGDAGQLLRMLEPAVRPGGLAGPNRPPPAVAIEGRTFDELLSEARGMAMAEPSPMDAMDGSTEAPAAGGPRPLAGLAGLDRIENASLRRAIASREL